MSIKTRINDIRQQINQVEKECGRTPHSVHLLAVSKGHPASLVEEAFHRGDIHHFAESYYQEALKKQKALSHLPLTWHFIGPIQSNKAKGIAEHFSWVHTVAKQEIAEQLNLFRPKDLAPLNVCIQVKLDNEATKSGIAPDEVADLIRFILPLPHLRLRGLMMIPAYNVEEQKQYESFLRLTELFHLLNNRLKIKMDTLSMGMSHDFKAAIRAQSTTLRIGTAIFGQRLQH